MKRVLITGAAGFIGTNTALALLRKGVAVIGLDSFDDNYPVAIKKKNVRDMRAYPNFTFYTADIRDQEKMHRIFKKEQPDAVLHLAAKADTRDAVVAPHVYVSTNVDGTLHVLEAAREVGVQRFVFASSSSVYGNDVEAPYLETAETGRAISPYGATKRAGEMLAFTYHHNFKMPVTCIRIFNAYGPRMRPGLVLHQWATKLLSGEPIELSGDGTRMRDFTYIDDLVDALMRALRDRMTSFAIVNVGNAHPVTLNELLSVLESVTKKRVEVIRRPSHTASVEMTHADITKAKEVLGWEPKTSLKKGVTAFVRSLSA